MPKISVIMPTYNCEQFIVRAVWSILNQTYKDFEFIIIDDGSTDNTPNIIESFDDPRIKLIRKYHVGYVYHLNLGIHISSGEYIARQDGDDWSTPDRFERQVKFLDDNPDYGLVSSNIAIVDEKNVLQKTMIYPQEPKFKDFMVKCCIPHGASMWRRYLHDLVGYYDETFNKGCCEDYDLWLRMIKVTKFRVLWNRLYYRTEHPNSSIALNDKRTIQHHDERAREKNK